MAGHECASTLPKLLLGSKILLAHKRPLAHQALPKDRTKLLEVTQSQKTSNLCPSHPDGVESVFKEVTIVPITIPVGSHHQNESEAVSTLAAIALMITNTRAHYYN